MRKLTSVGLSFGLKVALGVGILILWAAQANAGCCGLFGGPGAGGGCGGFGHPFRAMGRALTAPFGPKTYTGATYSYQYQSVTTGYSVPQACVTGNCATPQAVYTTVAPTAPVIIYPLGSLPTGSKCGPNGCPRP